MDEDGPPIDIVLKGSDADGDSLTFEIVNGPLNGLLSGSAPNVSYTPDPNFNGSDSFTFRDNDGFVNSNNAIVSINVRSINDLPILDDPIADQQAVEGRPFNFDISGNFFDADNEALQFTASGLPSSGNIRFSKKNGRFSGTPQVEDTDFLEGNTGIYNITVTATDGAGETAVDSFELVIAALDRANLSLDIDVTPSPAMLLDELRWTLLLGNLVGPQAGANVELRGSFIGAGLTVTESGTSNCTKNETVERIKGAEVE